MLVLETDKGSGAQPTDWRAELERDQAAVRGLAELVPHEPASLPADPAAAERIFARRLKRERLRRSWRQEDLAAKLADLGLDLHPSAIAKIEREPDPDKKIEPRMIRLNEAVTIAKAFGLSLEEMLSDRDLSDPIRELQELRDRLAKAHARAAAAHATLDMARRAAIDLETRARRAELRASLFMRLNVPEGQDARDLAERFLDYWLGRGRDDLIIGGWGRGDRGEPLSPDEVLGQISPIAQLWPDLEKPCAELTAKIESDAKWWIDEGRRRHDEWLREQMQLSEGDHVEHHRLGVGRVARVIESDDSITVIVDFEQHRSRAALGVKDLRKLAI